MSLRVRDVRQLQNQLLDWGSRAQLDEGAVAELTNWLEQIGMPDRVLDRQTFSALYECGRSESDPTVRQLAFGLLTWLPEAAERSLDLARFATCFVLRRIATLTNRPIPWGGVSIPVRDEKRATEIFEHAIEKANKPDSELLRSARQFIAKHEGHSDLFGRLGQDLAVLVDLLNAEDASPEEREVARAALDYFALDSDAIPDHLGLVGLLDDAFVVRLAVELVQPNRAALASFLDRVVVEWPFLRSLTLSYGDREYSLSEFMIINVALAFTSIMGENERTARVLITPEPGPLAMLIGWIRGLAIVRTFVDSDCEPRFEKGEKLEHRDGKAKYEFGGYGRLLPDRTFVECDPDEATHFQATCAGVIHRNPISDLALLVRPSSARKMKRDPYAVLAIERARLGPLERVFGVPTPITMPDEYGRVVVVAQLGESRSTVERLSLNETRLADIIPVEQAQIEENLPKAKQWGDATGGQALVTVVRSAAEALELIEIDPRETVAVVASVRPGSTDAVHLSTIASRAIPVLAIVEERDRDAIETFQGKDFAFWSWEDEWLGQLHWNSTSAAHPMAAYESDFRRRAAGRVEVVPLELPGLSEANFHLRRLDRASRDDEDERLNDVIRIGFNALVGLCRGHGPMQELSERIEDFARRVEGVSRWLNDEVVAASTGAVEALRAAVRAAMASNPKSEFVRAWMQSHPTGVILTLERAIKEAQCVPELSTLPWMHARRRTQIEGPVLVPAWLGKSTMLEMLVPPIAESVTLALYSPEREWFEALIRARRRARAQLAKLVRNRSALPIRAATLTEPFELPEPEPTVDDIVGRVRRRAILKRLGRSGASGGEPVRAKLVYFRGGYWAAFTPDHRVNSVTHLLAPRGRSGGQLGSFGADESEAAGDVGDSSATLREMPAAELRAGDLIVVVRGSEHDAIRHAADAELPRGLRAVAGEWREAIRRFLKSGGSVEELRGRLMEEGCQRELNTVRTWARDDRIIGPTGDETVWAIQRATEDTSLAEKAQECVDAIAQVRGTHFSVAHRLAQRVLAQAESRLGRGGPLELGDQLLLLTVEAVDGDVVEAPRREANRLMEGEDPE